MVKQKDLPQIAVLLVHRYDKAIFLRQLRQLDAVCKGNSHVGLFVYDAAYASSEHLERNDVLRLRTPMRLLQGNIRSELAAYNALFKSAEYDHHWALILDGVQLHEGWYKSLASVVGHRQVGLWGGNFDGDGNSTVHDKRWVDSRFWLVDLAVVKRLHGFEERYFLGDAAFRDFGWRVLQLGKHIGGIQTLPAFVIPREKYRLETMLRDYLEVRNQWLFTRLRLSLGKALMMMFWRLLIDGIGRGKLLYPGYRSGFWDGMRLWL